MYSIALGLLTLDFGAALISAPSNGDYDWMNEDWSHIRQEIAVIQRETSAKVIGVTGRFAEKGPHVVEILLPHIFVENEVVEHLLAKTDSSGLGKTKLREAVRTTCFSWGKLVSLNWSKLGYAPGGTEYCILPIDGPAISMGFLRLDWAGLRIRPSS